MDRISNRIDVEVTNKKVSHMVVAMQGLSEQIEQSLRMPEGLYGNKVAIKTASIDISNEDLDVEFTIPFDDDLEANEAEIIVYNLTQNTISQFKHDELITVTAGYGDDTGIIFSGRISKIKTRRVGNDKQTSIHAIDCQSLSERNIENIAYTKGTTASYILKDLIGKSQLPIAIFSTKRDHIYKDDVTIDGGLMDNIKKYAQVCGVSAYISKGKVYVRHVKDGDNISFTVSADTGLIDAPEETEEEVVAEDFKDVVTGYNIKMLLQHRVTTGAIINLKSEYISGSFRVRSGQHSYDGTDFITEMSVI